MARSTQGDAPAGLAGAFRHAGADATPRPQTKPKTKPRAKPRAKTPPPFSLRLSAEERAQLEREAGHTPLGAYIRSRLLAGSPGASPPARRNASRRPAGDDKALAQLLAALGQSRLANNLNQLAKAANSGSFLLTPEGEASLRDACAAIVAMRRDLIAALGLDAGDRP